MTLKNQFWAIALGILVMLASCTPQKPISQLKVIYTGSGKPAEGAVVYLDEHNYALRVNREGFVSIPEKFQAAVLPISTMAKNCKPVKLTATEDGQTIAIQIGDSMVSEIEKNLKIDPADSLRGDNGPYRSNYDLLYYNLDVKVDPAEKYLEGKNLVRFEMLKDGDTIQLELTPALQVDKILYKGQELSYERKYKSVFLAFPETLKKDATEEIEFYYSGNPKSEGRFGGVVFQEDSLGNPWIYTACQGPGPSVWWPNKDQQADEVDSMLIQISVPSDLVDVSNGKFMGKEELEDGYTKYVWKVHYPINNYSISMNIGKYTHFSDTLGDLPLDYYVLPYHLEQAKVQFAQAKPMLECYQNHFGEYAFMKDGYKLVEAPYSGMEHQSAVTYGNLFQNGYLGRDWTGVGTSMKFDFIIIHESGHEWFGNSITCHDYSDAWIHEGWCTYAEGVYVECMFGYDEAVKYINGYKEKVDNKTPMIGPIGVYHWPTQDIYFKGTLFMNTMRNVVNDDTKWWDFIKKYSEHFKRQNIYTTDVLNYFNEKLDRDFKAIFEQYLYRYTLPVLEMKFEGDSVQYRWNAEVADFDMPVKIGSGEKAKFIYPTTEWKTETLGELPKEDWKVDLDKFYIEMSEL
ncbi:M1 family metallopeptidase [Flammeovirgaceae bacterium SG7u.111]|nr:M1 family metallopeptidase [Flammeovirgaceae bacterium SG7u.132]WPO35144.1 M1 family metallopeptidase [Flammeovirgaceae bacterium SG7u.111]